MGIGIVARSISVSDEAFATIRREKRPHESDSDVILRIHKAARARERDPMSFFRDPPRAELTPEAYEETGRRMRAADKERHPGWDEHAGP